jgi:hypothetical protein
MHSSLALLKNSFIEAFADGSAYRGCEQGTLRYIDKSNNYTAEATTKLLGPKPGILLQMAEHFPHCSAGGRGVRPPTVTAEVSFQANQGRLPKDAPCSPCRTIFAPEKLNPPSYPGREPVVVG